MNQRINVMHLVWNLGRAGMEKGVFNICHRLPPEQFVPSICALEPGGAMESQVDPRRVTMLHVRRNFGNDPTVPLRLARQLRRLRIDVLHTHNWGTLMEGVIAAKLARTPVVIHGEHGKIADRRRRILAQRWAWRRVDQVLSVSDALADRMASLVGFPRDRIQVISNGVDTSRFRPSQTPKEELRRELGVPADCFLMGMVARFIEFKDHAGVFRAVAELREAGIEAHLALAGSGPLQEELTKLAGELQIADRVHFLGELNPVEPLLHALDVLVSNSSHNEGMSNAVLEAMACGVPVVATRVAASPQLLDEGSSGVLIPPRDTKALVRAIRQLLDKPEMQSSLGQAALRRIEERYSISSMVESYGRLYARLAALPRRRRHPETEDLSTTTPTTVSRGKT